MKDIPSLPTRIKGDDNGDLRRSLAAMRDRLRALINGSDRAVLLSEAGNIISGGTGGTGGSPGTGTGGTYVPDLTPPPMPSALNVVAGFGQVIITWGGITYTQGHGHKQAVIYAVKKDANDPTLPTFPGDENPYAVAPNALTIIALPSELNTRWHVWLKFESVDGVLSSAPAGGTNGVQGTTGQNINLLLSALSGQITESQLYAALASRIALVDGPSSTPNTVAWRLAQEAAARVAAIANEASARAQAILDEAAARATGDSSLQTQIDTLVAGTSGDLGDVLAAIATEQTARTTADAAEAAARQTLATQIRGDYTGTDPTALSSGLVYNERLTRITAETAIASDVSSLSATVAGNYSTLTAAITSEATARANADAAEAVERQAISAQVNHATTGLPATRALLLTDYYTKATVDSAFSSLTTTLTAAFQAADTAKLNEAKAYSETWAYSRAQADSAIATQVATVSARLNSGGDVNTSIAAAQSTANTAVTNAGTAQTAANAAATTANTVQAQVNNATTGLPAAHAAVATEASARATTDGYLGGQFTVRVNLTSAGRSVMGGFGISGTSAPGAQPTIDFGVRADKFWIGATDNGSAPGVPDILPFMVLTADTVENGVTIPKGVYMDAAYIRNLSALYARIAELVADSIHTASLSAAQLTAGDGTIGGTLKSANYVSGVSGWAAYPSGVFEASNAVIRGTVYATTGTFSGSLSGANITGATGTFSGSLSGANISGVVGTFTGSLSIQSAPSGQRLEMANNVIKVFDAAGVLRVKIGDLAA